MMKVLVTGSGGFIGSHLTELLMEVGFDVIAFTHYNSRGGAGWLDSLDILPDVETVAGDIRDFDLVSKTVQRVDAIFHLGALIGIPYSYVSPLAYLRTNVEGTYNILESALRHGVGEVVVTSTSEVYGSAQRIPIDEYHPLNAQSPYAASKIAADHLALSYHRSFGLPVKVIRPFNTYGPRQSSRAVIPTIITQLLAGKEEIQLGNLLPTRDLTFVRDTARAFLAVKQTEGFIGRVVNAGTGSEISIGDLAEKIAGILDVDLRLKSTCERARPKDSEVERLVCDCSMLTGETKWKPEFSLDEGLSETISWFRDHGGALHGLHGYSI